MSHFKILVADDDALYREILMVFGKKLGHTMSEVTSGNAAFEALLKEPFDALISDLRMPDGTGIELMKKIRNRGSELPKIPLISINTGMLEGGEKYVRSLGASLVWVKPVEIRKLFTAIENLLNDLSQNPADGAGGE